MINIHEVHAQRQAQKEPKRGWWKFYREPIRKHWARCGVRQSDLNYGGVR